MALTATATDRVRTDIIGQLKLRDPAVFVASFNRPTLTYTVVVSNSGSIDVSGGIISDTVPARSSSFGKLLNKPARSR